MITYYKGNRTGRYYCQYKGNVYTAFFEDVGNTQWRFYKRAIAVDFLNYSILDRLPSFVGPFQLPEEEKPKEKSKYLEIF